MVISLMIVGSSCTQFLRPSNPSGAGAEPVPTLQSMEKILSQFNSIQGTSILMAGVITMPATSESSLNPL
jgi:hypothetical protein